MNIKELEKREEFISCKKHNSADLLIWNYTNKCQFQKEWDEYTLQSRGLITDFKGNIISRPFKKFFNLNEREETKVENLPVEKPIITEKLDGSLGIQYYIEEKVYIATRGSFESEQAIWATQWMSKFKKSDFKKGYTYLYEIIYPENRIVVNYGDKQELLLLAVINNETGEELNHTKEAEILGINCAKIINNNIESIINSLDKMSGNEEGFVVKFGNLRVKIKGNEYVRLHRLITGFSTTSIWECLMNNQNLDDILEKVPDEFYNWIRIKEKELKDKFSEIENRIFIINNEIKNINNRKEQALYLQENYKNELSLIFSFIDGKDYKKQIWKQLKPKWELPFKEEYEEKI